jgi:hypothetical protein
VSKAPQHLGSGLKKASIAGGPLFFCLKGALNMEKIQDSKSNRREYLREYARQWRKRNPERERTNQENYWFRRLQRQRILPTSQAGIL